MLLDFAMMPASVRLRVPCGVWSWKSSPPRTSLLGIRKAE